MKGAVKESRVMQRMLLTPSKRPAPAHRSLRLSHMGQTVQGFSSDGGRWLRRDFPTPRGMFRGNHFKIKLELLKMSTSRTLGFLSKIEAKRLRFLLQQRDVGLWSRFHASFPSLISLKGSWASGFCLLPGLKPPRSSSSSSEAFWI